MCHIPVVILRGRPEFGWPGIVVDRGSMTRYAIQDRIFQAAVALTLLVVLGSFANGSAGRPRDSASTISTVQLPGARITRDLPTPEPLLFSDIDPQSARAINAAIPFSAAPVPAALPFTLTGDSVNRERAVDCLAAAMWYEAGNNDRGQRAVAQVVLNRVRHPAFPATVCGVVFQGSERTTGCQFTFTCDGALRRTPSELAWIETRARARSALGGFVYASVGLATHYHTDWVHPVWSAKLEKIAQVDTHLFFRWSGKWGQPAAMRQGYATHEQPIAKLAALSLSHRAALSEEEIMLADAIDEAHPASIDGKITLASLEAPATLAPTIEGVHFINAHGEGNGGSLAMQALNICGDQKFCKVVGWLESSDRGNALPSSAADREAVAFLYVRDRRTGVDRAFWNCSHFARHSSSQCLGADRARWIDFNGNFQSDRRSGVQNT